MSWADTLGNLRVLDQWRADVGLEYEIEKAGTPDERRSRAKRSAAAARRWHERPDAGARASRRRSWRSGFEFFPNFASASIMLDAFYERGGNLFDTACVYGGRQDREPFSATGTRSRGVRRDDFVLIGKGAHTPLCYPDVIAKQLDADRSTG